METSHGVSPPLLSLPAPCHYTHLIRTHFSQYAHTSSNTHTLHLILTHFSQNAHTSADTNALYPARTHFSQYAHVWLNTHTFDSTRTLFSQHTHTVNFRYAHTIKNFFCMHAWCMLIYAKLLIYAQAPTAVKRTSPMDMCSIAEIRTSPNAHVRTSPNWQVRTEDISIVSYISHTK